MPGRVESFGEVDSSKNRPKAWLEFVTPSQNELRKEQNLIKSTASRAETGLAGRENKIRFQKEE